MERERTGLVVVDVQERLFPHIHEHDALEAAIGRLVHGARMLALPILVTEQYVKGLGSTIASVREALEDAYAPLEKLAFSCCGDDAFVDALSGSGCRHVLLCGIETHVCVYQTAIDLLARGYYVHLITDAVGSRAPADRDVALRRIERDGALPTSVEMALFELLRVSGTSEFKAVSKIIK